MMRSLYITVILFVLAGAGVGLAAPAVGSAKIDSALQERLERGGSAPTLILLATQADTSAASRLPTKEAKGAAVVAALRAQADRDQPAVLAALAARGIQAQRFYSVNALSARLDLPAARMLAARPDVVALVDDSVQRRVEPTLPEPALLAAPDATEWGVNDVNAPAVWAQGFRGQGIVVAGQDTGVYWEHNALKNQYRGWNGVVADHNYNWHDAIHSSIGGGSNPCGYNTAAPCADHYHGTHTVGTIVGDDGGTNQIGVAPDAEWIACRNMDNGDGRASTYIECTDWMLAPYPIGGTAAQGDPAKAPDIVNNSWGCPASELCTGTPSDGIQQSVQSLSAAGIMFVSSAGNTGSGCGSISSPPALYPETFVVGNYQQNHAIAGSSSRGPISYNGSSRTGPNLAAPGTSVRSATTGGGPGAYTEASGTSMAAPHVVGVVALLWSARPELRGQLDLTRRILQETANRTVVSGGQTCAGIAETTFPNNTWGYGRIDALAAIKTTLAGAITINGTAAPSATLTIASPAMQFATTTGAYSTTLPSGAYTLTAQVPGFGPKSAVVTITSGAVKTQDFHFVNDVNIVDFGFSPQNLTVTVGTSVTWGNTGAVAHTTTSNTSLWDSGQLGAGQTFSRTFAAVGTFPYHCSIHENMTGTITVTALEAKHEVYLPLLRR